MKGMKERMNEGMNERKNERKNEGRKERKNERKNEGRKERRKDSWKLDFLEDYRFHRLNYIQFYCLNYFLISISISFHGIVCNHLRIQNFI